MSEREQVVRWLRAYAIERQEEFSTWVSLNVAADAIEAGDHMETGNE